MLNYRLHNFPYERKYLVRSNVIVNVKVTLYRLGFLSEIWGNAILEVGLLPTLQYSGCQKEIVKGNVNVSVYVIPYTFGYSKSRLK